MTTAPVNLDSALASIDTPYTPAIVSRYNDNKIAVVKVHGDFVWHSHPETDDVFLVLKGRMTIRMRDRDDVEMRAGELYVVPAGVEHCPTAEEECHVLLIEPNGTVNTGDAGGPLTAPERDIA